MRLFFKVAIVNFVSGVLFGYLSTLGRSNPNSELAYKCAGIGIPLLFFIIGFNLWYIAHLISSLFEWKKKIDKKIRE